MHYDLLLSSQDIANLLTFQKSPFLLFHKAQFSILTVYDMILSCILVTSTPTSLQAFGRASFLTLFYIAPDKL
jgi:hypothetical protein